MKLGAAFLADAAVANPDGTFMVWRGGITDTWIPGFPANIKYTLVLRLELDVAEARALHRLSLRMYYADRQVGETATIPLAVEPKPGDDRIYLNGIMDIGFAVTSEGDGHIEAVLDEDIRLPHLHFQVRQGTPPPPGDDRPTDPTALM